jgi:hypothetical protein
MRTGLRLGAFGLAATGIVSVAFSARQDLAGILLAIGAIGALALVAGWRADWLSAGMIYLGAIAGTSIAGNPANIPAMARVGIFDVVLSFALGYLLGYAFRRWYRPRRRPTPSEAPHTATIDTQRQAPRPDDGMARSQKARRSRVPAYGVLGWVIPGLIALPLAWGHESSGGESALLAVLVWWGLGVVGCLVSGVVVGMVGAGVQAEGATIDAFRYGLAGVATAWFAALAVSLAIETFVGVLHLGPAAFLLPIPFVFGYALGFGVGFVTGRSSVVAPTP